ncbi:putative Leucine-rich repeat protein kinase family protein [Hibiscus syriacus]|uniref:non-specific serine/threonine protein kinase n=1 Tax=Hibiscus syriacus TaxID=106335 RepID=A0A6A2YLK6_HIBSY|nr:putative receptor-like protein kinase At3g47110 [Hibiscus syriacus]KAE8680094.1 putative Leucine-rich repeat protein kinase family protein [Hibiscus syriacus]
MGNTFLSLALLLIVHFSMVTFSLKLTTILTDQSALLELKNRVTIDPKNVMATNWSTSTPVCNWFGVSCGFKHHRVTALNLSGLGLVGTLPPHLGNLSFLSLLSIRNNSFHGSLPAQLSDLHRLKYLNFAYNNFNGVISFSLGYLPQLETLNLMENQISGSIPSSIFNISSLQKIYISNNMLSGSIPSVPRDLLSLELIDFNYNNLTGQIPEDMFDHLPNLKELYLSVNMLSGRIPVSLFKCKELQMLSISFNQLEGSLPVEIGNLSMLQYIYVGRNHLEGEIPEQIMNLTLITTFDCSHNNFTGTISAQIGNQKNLEVLNLAGNNFVGTIPPAIFNISSLSIIGLDINKLSGHLPSTLGLWLPNLENFYLDFNNLVGSFPTLISNASQLTLLDMSSNYFSGSIPDNLGNLRNLRILNLADNNLASPGMSFLYSLASCRGLEFLLFGMNPLISGKLPGLIGNLSGSLLEFSAYGCNISGSIPGEIGNLSGLINIELDGNKLTGSIPASIGGLEELQSLSLTQNMLQGSIPYELCNLNKLAFMFLTSNNLSGPIPPCLGNLISLRKLLLGSNMFSSSIPSTLTRITDLLMLNLSSNSLSGPLPIDIGKWKVLTSMDLSNNRFSGDIPIGVVDLKDLTNFSLSNNRLTGSIPESFGDMFSLEFLDLSRNNLSGEIPRSLEKLRYLKCFNVSFNRLHGEIPEGGSFGNYSIESFEGNEALCGAPRLRVPTCKTKPIRSSKARTKLIIYVALPIASTILVVALFIIILKSKKRRDKLQIQEDLLPFGTRRRFSYHELHQATDGFNQSKLLGNGSYGSVYQGTFSDGMTFAVKVFKLELEKAFKSFDVECEVLCTTRHRNLIKIISSCTNNLDFKALVLEFMPNGSLDKWLYSNNHFLDILQRLNIMIDVASALEYLHHGNATLIVHCDLKPSNVLLDEDMVAHLSDFGIAKLLCNDDSMIQTMTMATVGYMAPEYGTEGIVSTKGDVYSFGILVMETLTKRRPTDEMFAGERSLKSWVKDSISSSLNQLADTNLFSATGKDCSAANNCALSILRVGLECCVELPAERPDVKEVVAKLNKIKVEILKDIELVL